MSNLAENAGSPRIGTALTPGATKVLLLGSGELGKEVVIAFQRLGVETIAVDRYANAPAMQVAHRSHVIDMTDAAAVHEVIETERPHFVVPEIEALATDALVEVEELGLAEVIPTARAVSLTLDREGIRTLAAEKLGLPCSPYRFAGSPEELRAAASEVGYPCVIKPVMSSSGKGQSVVRSPGELEEAWDYALGGARVRNERVIVEGFVDFDYEITLLTVRVYDPERGKVVTRFCEPIGHRQDDGDYVESWQPQAMSQAAYDAACSVAGRIATALGDGAQGGRGVFGVELFVKGDDVYFSEVSPRPHDTGLVTLGSQRLSEFELHARAVLGLPVDTTLMSPAASTVIRATTDSTSVAFDGVARALALPETEVRLFGKPEGFPRRRLGVVVATADTVEVARGTVADAAAMITVVDSADPVAPPAPSTVAIPVAAPRPDEDLATRAMPVQRPSGPGAPGPGAAGPGPVGAGPAPVGPGPQGPVPPPVPPQRGPVPPAGGPFPPGGAPAGGAGTPVPPPLPPQPGPGLAGLARPGADGPDDAEAAPPTAAHPVRRPAPSAPIGDDDAPTTSVHPVRRPRGSGPVPPPAPPGAPDRPVPMQPAPRPPLADLAAERSDDAPDEPDSNPPTSLGLPPQRPDQR